MGSNGAVFSYHLSVCGSPSLLSPPLMHMLTADSPSPLWCLRARFGSFDRVGPPLPPDATTARYLRHFFYTFDRALIRLRQQVGNVTWALLNVGDVAASDVVDGDHILSFGPGFTDWPDAVAAIEAAEAEEELEWEEQMEKEEREWVQAELLTAETQDDDGDENQDCDTEVDNGQGEEEEEEKDQDYDKEKPSLFLK
ncbi:hypothetical protein VNI00_014991 [Paramarasmius palmivorus]|uniref:Uncharacterized protein n=1 Tax=Paramarasmius palmivorus TaxID=297713 RepID=A0AAW0BNW8_9AGAR